MDIGFRMNTQKHKQAPYTPFKTASLTFGIAMALTINQTVIAESVESVQGQLDRLEKRVNDENQRLKVNGFATVAATIGSEEVPYNLIDDQVNFKDYSKAGVQLTFNLSDRSSFVTQYLAKGQDDWNLVADWAYFKHQVNDELSVKIGRFRAPYFLLSEYLDVTYASPWLEMPPEIYGTLSPFSTFEGFDLSYDMDLDFATATVQAQFGRNGVTEYDLKNLANLNLTLSGNDWSVRVGHSQANVELIDDGSNDPTSIFNLVSALQPFGEELENSGIFQGIAFRYEPGNLLIISEMTQLKIDGILNNEESMYFTLGYRVGNWTPTLTYAQVQTVDDDDRTTTVADPTIQGIYAGLAASLNSDTKRTGFALRYDYSPGIAYKLSYDMIDTGDVPGAFSSGEWTPDVEGTNIFSLGVDLAF